jgi:hypothetical protein
VGDESEYIHDYVFVSDFGEDPMVRFLNKEQTKPKQIVTVKHLYKLISAHR